jgi:hypothetical protein
MKLKSSELQSTDENPMISHPMIDSASTIQIITSAKVANVRNPESFATSSSPTVF